MFQDPTYNRTKGSYVCLLPHGFDSSVLELSSSKSLKELLKLLLYKRIRQCNSDRRLRKAAGRTCLLSNHCNSDLCTDRTAAWQTSISFHQHSESVTVIYSRTATSKSSINNFPHKWRQPKLGKSLGGGVRFPHAERRRAALPPPDILMNVPPLLQSFPEGCGPRAG